MGLNNIDFPADGNCDSTMMPAGEFHSKTKNKLMSITDGGSESGGNGKNISNGESFSNGPYHWSCEKGFDLGGYKTLRDFVLNIDLYAFLDGELQIPGLSCADSSPM